MNERTSVHVVMQNEHFAGDGVLKKAVEIGYKIMKIHEFWHFPKDQRKEGLFAPYVNSSLKYKTEAKGWAKHCDTQEQKDQ